MFTYIANLINTDIVLNTWGTGDAFDFFRQETSNIDPVIRANAMGKATIICAMMGADKSRNELVPYLKS